MPGRRGNHRLRQSPQPEQVRADLGMAGAECLLLNLPDREVSAEPFPKGGRVLRAERVREHELPDIVQHPCGRDFGQHLRRSAMVPCDGVRAPAHPCGVPGQRIHVVPALTIALESEEDLHREDQASDGVQPQELHSVTAGRDLLRAPEESRIGQLQQLGRHAQVTLDDGSHSRCRGVRRIQLRQHFAIHRRNGRKRLEPAGQLVQTSVRQQRAQRERLRNS